MPPIFLALLAVAGGLYYFTRVDTSNWKTYTNTIYGYELKYPADMKVDYVGEYATIPVEQSDDPMIYFPGGPTEFGVTAYLSDTSHNSPAIRERNNLITLPLPQFSEEIRQMQVNDKNIHVLNKQIGELKEITFVGQKAYSFTLTESFSRGLSGGYALGLEGSHAFNFIFVENKNGIKLMIRYPLGDAIAERIKDSFKLTIPVN